MAQTDKNPDSKRDSFIFYRSFFDATKPLGEKQKAQLFDAICEFALNQTETKPEPVVSAMFLLIKPQLEANNRRFENGKKGGRPKQIKTETEPKLNQTETKPEPNVNGNVNVNVNENGNGNESRLKKTFSDLVLENEFCDHGYIDKMREQIPRCKKEDIEKIKHKTEVMRNCVIGGKIGKAKIIFHEIAGLINDSQQQKLSDV